MNLESELHSEQSTPRGNCETSTFSGMNEAQLPIKTSTHNSLSPEEKLQQEIQQLENQIRVHQRKYLDLETDCPEIVVLRKEIGLIESNNHDLEERIAKLSPIEQFNDSPFTKEMVESHEALVRCILEEGTNENEIAQILAESLGTLQTARHIECENSSRMKQLREYEQEIQQLEPIVSELEASLQHSWDQNSKQSQNALQHLYSRHLTASTSSSNPVEHKNVQRLLERIMSCQSTLADLEHHGVAMDLQIRKVLEIFQQLESKTLENVLNDGTLGNSARDYLEAKLALRNEKISTLWEPCIANSHHNTTEIRNCTASGLRSDVETIRTALVLNNHFTTHAVARMLQDTNKLEEELEENKSMEQQVKDSVRTRMKESHEKKINLLKKSFRIQCSDLEEKEAELIRKVKRDVEHSTRELMEPVLRKKHERFQDARIKLQETEKHLATVTKQFEEVRTSYLIESQQTFARMQHMKTEHDSKLSLKESLELEADSLRSELWQLFGSAAIPTVDLMASMDETIAVLNVEELVQIRGNVM